MPFQEKSAWIMSFALLTTGAFYFSAVISMSEQGQLAPPILPILVVYTIALSVIAIVGHILVALFATKDANAKPDERDRRIFDRAGYLSSNVFGFGVISSLILYLFSYNGNLLFYTVFGSLILGQLLEYLMQIYFYRWSIY